ncbi:MAG: hypothetical protein HYZ91_07210 [Candidatus Omnitrophica bacterium]|nr:hypothetical protein [Candidatus Omnitrophota bacterium]
MRPFLPVVLGGCLVCALPTGAFALEERFDDLSVSVEVAPVFSFSVNNPHLAFGPVAPNTTVVLGEGHFFHEITCRSNVGRTWYLKGQLLSLTHAETRYALPPASLKWRIAASTGTSAGLAEGANFQPLSNEPVLLYTGQGNDTRGREVILRLQYSLSTPPEAPAGNYVGSVIFTMTESP